MEKSSYTCFILLMMNLVAVSVIIIEKLCNKKILQTFESKSTHQPFIDLEHSFNEKALQKYVEKSQAVVQTNRRG